MKKIISIFLFFLPIAVASEEITIPLPGGESMEFVWIEPGTFTMGTSEEWKEKWDEFNSSLHHELSFRAIPYSREFPKHSVTISKGFYMGKYEVNRGQWFAVMEPNREDRRSQSPIGRITVFEAMEYLETLSQQSGLTFRLPTEAEWEYAARAGSSSLWWFGDEWEDAEHGPNPWGLNNMVGGQCEYTSDALRFYSNEPQADPISPYRPKPGGMVVLRGGDGGGYQSLVEWPTHPWYTRSAYRMNVNTSLTMRSFGFRVVLEEEGITGIERKGWGEIKRKAEEGN